MAGTPSHIALIKLTPVCHDLNLVEAHPGVLDLIFFVILLRVVESYSCSRKTTLNLGTKFGYGRLPIDPAQRPTRLG
ncbi:MAG: hypothetical protein Q7T78_20070, partial [Rhodoferax sp.]|nr:hypothetical protein [Rhodoferax sp.]